MNSVEDWTPSEFIQWVKFKSQENIEGIKIVANNPPLYTDKSFIEYYSGHDYKRPFFDELHTILIKELSQQLSNKYYCYLYQLGLFIESDELPDSILTQDLALYFDKPTVEGSSDSSEKLTTDIPDIVFEIATSPETLGEITSKLSCYDALGVKECWIIDTYNCEVEMHDNINRNIMFYNMTGDLHSLVYDNLILNLGQAYKVLIDRLLIPAGREYQKFGKYIDPENKDFEPCEWLAQDY